MMIMYEKLLGFLGTVLVTANQAESAIKEYVEGFELSLAFRKHVASPRSQCVAVSGTKF